MYFNLLINYSMEEAKKLELKKAIEKYLLPSNKFNDTSSYGLKHLFERIIGQYVSNDEMKECMIECGFHPKRVTESNHHYKFRVKPAQETQGYYDIFKPEADDNILLKVLWANRLEKRDDMIGDLCNDLLRDPDFIFLTSIDKMLNYITKIPSRSHIATEAVCLFITNFCNAFTQYKKYIKKLDKEDLEFYEDAKCKLSFRGINGIEIKKAQRDSDTDLEIKLDKIHYISISYLANRFFGKSRSWLNNKIRENDDARRKTKYKLSNEELIQLKQGLLIISEEIRNVAESL